MAGSLNKVILVGNLGNDPEIRQTQSGDKVATLSIATSESYKDKSGQKQTKTEWHRVVMFGRIAEVAEQYLRKGSKVLIEGKLQTRSYDKNGQTVYTTEIVLPPFSGVMTMLDSVNASGGQDSNYQKGSSQPPQSFGGNSPDLDDDIPF